MLHKLTDEPEDNKPKRKMNPKSLENLKQVSNARVETLEDRASSIATERDYRKKPSNLRNFLRYFYTPLYLLFFQLRLTSY
jgi:hypothetical protein